MEYDVNFISSILILTSSIIPAYLIFRLKNELRILTVLLTVFLLVHGTYHVLSALGFGLLGEGVFEPASVGVLIVFGMVYIKTKKRSVPA